MGPLCVGAAADRRAACEDWLTQAVDWRQPCRRRLMVSDVIHTTEMGPGSQPVPTTCASEAALVQSEQALPAAALLQ